MVAIGHEVDISLAELAADLRASTPSNAAELLVPERQEQLSKLHGSTQELHEAVSMLTSNNFDQREQAVDELHTAVSEYLENVSKDLKSKKRMLDAMSPQAVLERGYAVVRGSNGRVVKSSKNLKGVIDVRFADGSVKAEVQ